MFQLFKQRNFSFYWLSHLISVIGDHVTLVAFPWLALQLTDSVAMMGLVAAVQGLPRALLMLTGGAVVDRSTPRRIIQMTNVVRMILVAILAVALYQDQASIELLFGVALGFGLCEAFFFPASTAILPAIIEEDELQAGNAIIHTTSWLSLIIGPVLAGFLIAGEFNTTMMHELDAVTGSTYDTDRAGLARAFAFDALTFFLSFLALIFVAGRPLHADERDDQKGLLGQIGEALYFVWQVPALKLVFIGIALLDFLYQAPVFVGLPALAKARFEDGVAVFSLWLAGYGTGSLLGAIVGGTMQPLLGKRLVRLTFLAFAWSGASLAFAVFGTSWWWPMIVFGIAGFFDNLVWVHMMTWIQKVSPKPLLGRVMSVFMFLSVGLLPIAYGVAGLVFEINLEGTLVIMSASMVIICLVCAFHPNAGRVHFEGDRERLPS